jgi:hypothetical protein
MKAFHKGLLIALGLAAVAGGASAQSSATQSTTGTGTILQPISLTKDSDLAFGLIVRPSSGTNTVTINQTTGARALSGGGNAALVTSTTSRATYTVGGEGASTFSITVPANFNMTRSGGSETLAVTLTPTATSGTLSGSAGASGTATFGVGGAFPLDNTTVTGAYSGTFNTTVAYN